MYFPKSQYTLKDVSKLDSSALQDAAGTIIDLPGGKVVQTSLGAIFDPKTVDLERGDFSNAVRLFPIPGSEDKDEAPLGGSTDLRSSLNSTVSLKLPPTSEDLNRGVMKRCFLKNKCTGKVQEISKTQYQKQVNIQDRCTSVQCIDWIIKGPAKDQTVNGYYLAGVESRNEKQLQKLKEALPGAEALIQSPTEYLQEITIPGAQQASSSPLGLNIPAPSKGL